MEHPWAQLLRFRKTLFEGPCEANVLAIKGPYFSHFSEKETMGYTQSFEIGNGASFGKLIIIQEKSNLKDHVRTMFWP